MFLFWIKLIFNSVVTAASSEDGSLNVSCNVSRLNHVVMDTFSLMFANPFLTKLCRDEKNI